jgi:hypothetical protein
MTIILCGTSETIPSDVLQQLMDSAHAGKERLTVVDEGSQLARLYADLDRDILLDPARGNWDFFADHVSELELAQAGEAVLRSTTAPKAAYHGASCILSGLLWGAAAQPGATLHDVSTLVRGLSYARIAEDMRLDLGSSADTRTGWSALALLQEKAGRFAKQCPTLPPISLRRWLIEKKRSVLFIAAGASVHDGACRSVAGALERIATLEADAGREVEVAWDGTNPTPISAEWMTVSEMSAHPERSRVERIQR